MKYERQDRDLDVQSPATRPVPCLPLPFPASTYTSAKREHHGDVVGDCQLPYCYALWLALCKRNRGAQGSLVATVFTAGKYLWLIYLPHCTRALGSLDEDGTLPFTVVESHTLSANIPQACYLGSSDDFLPMRSRPSSGYGAAPVPCPLSLNAIQVVLGPWHGDMSSLTMLCPFCIRGGARNRTEDFCGKPVVTRHATLMSIIGSAD